MKPKLVIVAAVARNGVIGNKGITPWHIPTDLQRFKSLTMGKPLLMGSKTFRAIGRALPGRETIVLSRESQFTDAGIHPAHRLEDALALGAEIAAKMCSSELMICGGAEIYASLINSAETMHLTHVDLAPEGDAFFPQIDWGHWTKIEPVTSRPATNSEPACTFAAYRKTEFI